MLANVAYAGISRTLYKCVIHLIFRKYIVSMQQIVTKRMTGILAGTMLLLAIVAIATPKAEAASGMVYMKIYNKKTDTEKVITWQPKAYRFEKKVFIDADHLKVKKISQIFNATELKVRNTILADPQTATWQHFVVTIGSDTYRQVNFL